MTFPESSESTVLPTNVMISACLPRPIMPSSIMPAISWPKRTQRVQWMQRVMSVEMSGPRFLLGRTRLGSSSRVPLPPAVRGCGGDVSPHGAWYDEMLSSGNTIAVIGYSYARGGTEVGLFEISRGGALRYQATYHLRSNDYYSSRNYASRLIGSKLIFYTPLYLNPWGGDPFASFPAMRRWRAGATAAEFKRIAPATRISRTDEELDPN